jgi:hypothetical protein
LGRQIPSAQQGGGVGRSNDGGGPAPSANSPTHIPKTMLAMNRMFNFMLALSERREPRGGPIASQSKFASND